MSSDVQYVVKEITAILNGTITPINSINAVMHGVLVMRKFHALSGEQKKQMLIEALDVLVSQSGLAAKDQENLECIVQFTVPNVIDGFHWFATSGVQMSRGCCTC